MKPTAAGVAEYLGKHATVSRRDAAIRSAEP